MFVEFCITFIKIILFNSCSSLAFLKMKGQKVENYTKKTIATILNIIIALGYAALYNIASLQKYNVPIANFICYLIYMASFSIIINNNVMNNITPIAISITISYINLFLTTMISFLVLKVLTLDITKNTIIEYFIIGLFQGIALLPGISRSGSTLTGGLLRNIKKEDAVKFSFMLYLPISIASFILGIKDFTTSNNFNNLYISYILSFIFSFITTYFATKWFINIIKKKKLIYFSIYCFIVGLLVLIFM